MAYLRETQAPQIRKGLVVIQRGGRVGVQVAYDERALKYALKKTKEKNAPLAWAHDGVELEMDGISPVPWTYWS